MRGSSIITGLGITLKKFFQKKVTEQYPEVKPNLPARSRGSFDFYPEKCISCNLCAMACPNGVIKVESHKGESGKKVLDNYKMSLGYCLFCGLCVEACPTDAIKFKTDFEFAYFSRDEFDISWKGCVQKEEVVEAESGKEE